MKTAIIGATFVDVKGFAFDQYVPTGTNIGRVEITHGGVCRNVAADFAAQGEQVLFVSCVDDTALGRDILERLKGAGVDTRYVRTSENGMGMWLAVLNNLGTLEGSISRQPDFTALEQCLQEKGNEIFAQADAVVAELDTCPAIAERVLDLAEKHGRPVYIVVGNLGVIMQHPEYLRRTRCLICNDIEAGRLLDADLTVLSPQSMMDVLLRAIETLGMPSMVITLGSKGAVYCDTAAGTGEPGYCPAIPTNVEDSTGAGDAFLAGTVMALGRGLPLERAVQAGTRLASATLACSESSCGRIEDLFD